MAVEIYFSDLVQYTQDLPSDTGSFEPFVLLGLLANYNKFEYRNPYRLRLEDFVNEAAIQRIVNGVAEACLRSRARYTDIVDDLPTDPGWSLASTLHYIGLGMLAPIKAITPAPSAEDQKEKFLPLSVPGSLVIGLR